MYADTWGARLEGALANDTQVLNFGVDGYGIDQIVLRYQRDVVPWHPEIVILGFIADDLRRTFCVYAFLCFKAFGEIPFAKPRFVVDSSGLRQLNSPLPSPESIFSRESLAAVPFVEHDESYVPEEWQWHFAYHSYLMRFVISRFPRWSQRPPRPDSERIAVNSALLKRFIRLAQDNGSVPVVLAFPGSHDFSPTDPATASARRSRHWASHSSI